MACRIFGKYIKFCQKINFTHEVHTCSRIVDLHRLKPIGSQTEIKGWVKSLRKMKDVVFIDVSDGSCSKKLQVLIPKVKQPEGLSYGASVTASGQLTMNHNNQLEIAAEELLVLGPCDVSNGYPFVARKSYPADYTRQYLHLRPRTATFAALLRVRDAATRAIHQHFHDRGFIHIHTPILTSNDCEGAGEVFSVRPESEELARGMMKEGGTRDQAYFDTKAYLTVSGQLHLEAVVRGLGNAFTFGPTFRAENSRTRHHLSEFYMVEAEAAFMDSLEQLLPVLEDLVCDISRRLMEDCAADITLLASTHGTSGPGQLAAPFGVMGYNEALDILDRHPHRFQARARRGQGLSKEHELFLVEHHGGRPVFVVDWPAESKPFYMKHSEDPTKVAAVDLLVPHVGELAGGSLREDDLSLLQGKLAGAQLLDSLGWYLDLRRHGNISTGGFGMGFERYLQCILGIPNIKDTIPFPRWPHNCRL